MGNIFYNIPTSAYGSSRESAIDSLVVALNLTGYPTRCGGFCREKSVCEDLIAIDGMGYYKVDILKNGSEDNMWQVGLKYTGNSVGCG